MAHVQRYGATRPLNQSMNVAESERDMLDPMSKTELDLILDNQEKSLWLIVYCCICCLGSLMPISEIAILIYFWNDHGSCSAKFQWLIVAKLIITFLGVDCLCVCRNKRFDLVLLITLILYFAWCIPSSIIFFTENQNDDPNDSCNSGRTSIYYDFMWIELLLIYCLIIIGCCIASWFAMAVGFSSYKSENMCYSFVKTLVIALLLTCPICEAVMLGLYFNDYGECPFTFQWIILSKLSLELVLILFGYCVVKKRLYVSYRRCVKTLLALLLVLWCCAATTFLFAYDINHQECNKGRTGTYYDFMWVELMMSYLVMMFWFCAEIWIKIAFALAPRDEF